MDPRIKITLFSSPQCSLCDDVKYEVLEPLLKGQDEHFKLVIKNIHEIGNEEWRRKYAYDIPVLHFNGKLVAKNKQITQQLVKELLQLNHKS